MKLDFETDNQTKDFIGMYGFDKNDEKVEIAYENHGIYDSEELLEFYEKVEYIVFPRFKHQQVLNKIDDEINFYKGDFHNDSTGKIHLAQWVACCGK